MELLGKIRLKIGDIILRNKIAGTKRKAHYSGLSQVRNIGIVWDASMTEDFVFLSRFYQKMHDSATNVKILAYFPGKVLPNQYTAVRYLTVIKREELNLFYHPVSKETQAFVDNHFDVLIDLNFKKMVPLQYISSLSNAGLKVGLFDAGTADSPFDVMMELKNPVNAETYLDHVMHYLGMINSGIAAKVE